METITQVVLDTLILVAIIEILLREDRPELLQVGVVSLIVALLIGLAMGPVRLIFGLFGYVPMFLIEFAILLFGLRMTPKQTAIVLGLFLVVVRPVLSLVF